jgi:hypothetical protein
MEALYVAAVSKLKPSYNPRSTFVGPTWQVMQISTKGDLNINRVVEEDSVHTSV